ncbi:tRNA (adenosine(37)-N6)-threonylcarbamoyltransferase complex dimerization subunit type 1 TsaB [Methylophilaceae bacterium]|jgi:tRNA threonylcarbamoyladenosine biosynthesis protein TsaB|nr:tRNA (adenosine(37)-N6)-threonylcarbamoyltransferase complex dimerization subunit type 1 TsaB [Methylophilaceae bacterium]|tara:strand:+ start:1685 stop:2365 length:681 start_codon:yes stop_codon:yes gene_type:complete
MKILSIDACTETISIALIVGNIITEKNFPSGKNYSGNILQEIKILLNESNLKIENIEGIAFGAGPGSFTGIRVACGIAYGLAYANNLPIIGVNTLEALAFLSQHENSISCIDARMGQVYLGIYQNRNDVITPLVDPGLFNPNELPDQPKIKKAIVIGSGLSSYKEQFKSQYADIELEYFEGKCKLASAIGILSIGQFGNEFNLKNATPIYIRNKVALTEKERLNQQ